MGGKLERKEKKLGKVKEQYLDEVRNKPGVSNRQTRKGEKFNKTVKQVNELRRQKREGPGKKGDDIEIKKGNQGKFGAWVDKNMPGKDTCAAASSVMKNKKKYSSSVVKMANFAKNFGCAKK